MTSPSSAPRSARLRGVAGTILYFAVVAALVVFLFRLAPDTDLTAATTIPQQQTTTTTTPPEVRVDAPTYVAGDEPIADAAAIILPSVVHIQTSTGVGSGVVYDNQGLIITAAHVVGSDETVQIRFSNGDLRTGRVLGTVPEVDVAVIETDPIDLPAAVFNPAKPRVGQMAIAVGSPWGLASTVTAGIVSAVDQTNCGQSTCAAMVQTDAAINPGNSGGALINRAGEVIGINVSIFTLSGANDGVGFAVPSSTVLDYARAIISGEPLRTSFLGVDGTTASSGRAGGLITEVLAGTGAEAAGLRVDDVVVEVSGVPVVSWGDLVAQVRVHRPGATIDLVILRDDEELVVSVTLGVRTEELS